MPLTEVKAFQYVEEKSDPFLALFPHRYDFIYAAHPHPKEKPDWRSESRYPLSDRQLLEGEYLYGVRFEKNTQYLLLDIDRTSVYHPGRAPLVVERLLGALEPLGIISSIVCTSSDSQGIHVYCPLAQPFNSWKLAKAAEIALVNAGFKLKLGQLELFPNPRAYSVETPTLFNAHRLPLQMGSYILNSEFQATSGSKLAFVRQWKFCQQQNTLNKRQVAKLLKKAQKLSCSLSHKAGKFLGDLDTEIEEGWTSHGQTNRLLGRIALRSFVFNHVFEGGDPLEGKALIEKIVSVAKERSGYKDWCRHQHEIEDRAAEWARCVENSHYFAYGTAKGKYKKRLLPSGTDSEPDYNQQRAQETQRKIAAAVAILRSENALPERATARFKALLSYHIGGASLYRYRELWHPIELVTDAKNELEKFEPYVMPFKAACTEGANGLKTPTSLLIGNDSNTPDGQCLSDRPAVFVPVKGSNDDLDSAQALRDRIKQQLAQTQKARAQAAAEPNPRRETSTNIVHKQALQRMREFLLSGEPILLIEVGQWLIKQPQRVRDELIADSNSSLQTLMMDLSAIAMHLVPMRWSSLEVRSQLEARYGKLTILELTGSERLSWQAVLEELSRLQNSS